MKTKQQISFLNTEGKMRVQSQGSDEQGDLESQPGEASGSSDIAPTTICPLCFHQRAQRGRGMHHGHRVG